MIPDEAVEAAARAFYGTALDDVSDEDLEYAKEGARLALEAAAPHLMAAAWDEAMAKAHELAWEHDSSAASAIHEAPNPYRKPTDAV